MKSNPPVTSHDSKIGVQSIVDYPDVIEKVGTGSIAENNVDITLRQSIKVEKSSKPCRVYSTMQIMYSKEQKIDPFIKTKY